MVVAVILRASFWNGVSLMHSRNYLLVLAATYLLVLAATVIALLTALLNTA
jgi:hypothetical protein